MGEVTVVDVGGRWTRVTAVEVAKWLPSVCVLNRPGHIE